MCMSYLILTLVERCRLSPFSSAVSVLSSPPPWPTCPDLPTTTMARWHYSCTNPEASNGTPQPVAAIEYGFIRGHVVHKTLLYILRLKVIEMRCGKASRVFNVLETSSLAVRMHTVPHMYMYMCTPYHACIRMCVHSTTHVCVFCTTHVCVYTVLCNCMYVFTLCKPACVYIVS